MKIYFKILELSANRTAAYTVAYTFLETHFFTPNQYGSKEECQAVIRDMGQYGKQYAIVEVVEKE